MKLTAISPNNEFIIIYILLFFRKTELPQNVFDTVKELRLLKRLTVTLVCSLSQHQSLWKIHHDFFVYKPHKPSRN